MSELVHENYLDTLNTISSAITSDLYLEDILKLIVTLTANVMKAKVCNVWLLDKEKQEFNIKATQAMHQEYLEKRTIKTNEGIVGLVAQSKKPVVISDILQDERYKEKLLAKKDGLVSMASLPMKVNRKVIGVLNVYTTSFYHFTKADIDLLGTIANQAAFAIVKTELIVKTKIIQEELEARKKIERAKSILMQERNMSENEAFSLIRKSSMDKRISMKDISEAIILSYEIKEKK